MLHTWNGDGVKALFWQSWPKFVLSVAIKQSTDRLPVCLSGQTFPQILHAKLYHSNKSPEEKSLRHKEVTSSKLRFVKQTSSHSSSTNPCLLLFYFGSFQKLLSPAVGLLLFRFLCLSLLPLLRDKILPSCVILWHVLVIPPSFSTFPLSISGIEVGGHCFL